MWWRSRNWYRGLRADLCEVERSQSGANLAISVNLMTEVEIDEFMDALAELEDIRIDANKALVGAASH